MSRASENGEVNRLHGLAPTGHDLNRKLGSSSVLLAVSIAATATATAATSTSSLGISGPGSVGGTLLELGPLSFILPVCSSLYTSDGSRPFRSFDESFTLEVVGAIDAIIDYREIVIFLLKHVEGSRNEILSVSA